LFFNDRVETRAREIADGKRVLYLNGSRQEDSGFSIGTVTVDNLDIENEIAKGTISRQVSVDEARLFVENPNLTNKDTLTSLLARIDNS